jgi:hypothetical protein
MDQQQKLKQTKLPQPGLISEFLPKEHVRKKKTERLTSWRGGVRAKATGSKSGKKQKRHTNNTQEGKQK